MKCPLSAPNTANRSQRAPKKIDRGGDDHIPPRSCTQTHTHT